MNAREIQYCIDGLGKERVAQIETAKRRKSGESKVVEIEALIAKLATQLIDAQEGK